MFLNKKHLKKHVYTKRERSFLIYYHSPKFISLWMLIVDFLKLFNLIL